VNGDGKLDIVTSNTIIGDTVSVFLSKGDGTFATQVSYQTGDDPFSVVLGDLNGDGKVDIATANAYDRTVSILFGKGDGTFAAKVDYPSGAGSLALGDVNGDGKLDLVLTTDDSVSVRKNACQ
jgi:hypothetical protein